MPAATKPSQRARRGFAGKPLKYYLLNSCSSIRKFRIICRRSQKTIDINVTKVTVDVICMGRYLRYQIQHMMEVAGYLSSVIIGIALGLIGGGVRTFTVPVLVYLFSIDSVLAPAYSIFIFGKYGMIRWF